MLLCQLVARFTISLIQFLRLITFKSKDYKCILLQRLKKKSLEIIKSKFKFKSTVGKSICKFEPNSKKMLISGNLNQSKSEIIPDRVDLINLI